ncbi:bifunctional YncE family protein/alkaline phosphatase family protein [Sediminibacterium soli]|uniref:bifunctional YncE family protein/alkaline phosphatase family protein n=1 Tax=Sediminibacterium soli TaxID=2698829 RepID=UPI00137950C7|nr:bifunctional YncE family protein/alkaline phosphatase family protein [Sediminibacterium soli]NCI47625.1 bifunctional YncE family protein/alkaline phosphatase family protein [Sediminibacterium soli]
MRKLLFVCCIGIAYASFSQTISDIESKKVMLPNGWGLTPVGRSFQLGDLPLNIAVSKSKKLMAVTNNGQSVQSIQLIDPESEKMIDSVIVPKSWYGLVFSGDEKRLYASGGHDNWILEYAIENKKLVLKDSIILGKKWPNRIAPAGIAIDDNKQLLYVVTRDDHYLYTIDLRTKNIKQKFSLGAEAYACMLSPNKKELYISCWGCDKVYVFDTEKNNIVSEITVGDNPNELCLTASGKYLYVANSNDNSVSVIDTKQRKVIETLNAALYPDAPNGSTTNGIALSKNEKTLYIANADNNCVTVFDVAVPVKSKSKGFIPVGWYPTNVKVIGKKLFVSNGKGFSSMANVYGPNPLGNKQIVLHHEGDPERPKNVQYIAGLFQGTMTVMEEPTEQQLSVYSQVVYRNTPYNKVKEMFTQGETGNPIPRKVGDPSPIKYVFYIIKENRTYDQVLGDMKEGNGDPRLVLFGEHITPNQHALAREFVLLDNFYVDGEVSADGHNWTMGAYATDFLEKSWVSSYGGRGGSYDGEGNREAANNKGGFIWDHCKKAGVSYRSYGEFVDNFKANIPSLKNHFCPYFNGYDNRIPDTTRFFQWKREFDSLVSVNAVPKFNSVRFGNDHTEGLRKGRPTPYAHVADNDLAVGLFVEHLSKSPIWKEAAVFIIEDDAQNGADHVDAHRSTAYVAGGFVKRGLVDHTMYSTSSMLRTMELILGIPPMSQYDAAAQPMWRCFSSETNPAGFTARMAKVDLNERNTAMNEWQQRSEKFNLAKEDAVPDLEFNIVLWHGLKGDNVPFPGPKRAAFFKPIKKADDDDD